MKVGTDLSRIARHSGMKIKVINPNTTASMTQKIEAAARAAASPGTVVTASSPQSGPASIETYRDEAIATLGVLEEIDRGEEEGVDGYVIACFGDPGLLAARERARGPVVGIAESSMHVASFFSDGFTIVSMPSFAIASVERLVHGYDMNRKCRGIRMLDVPVLALEHDAAATRVLILNACARALVEDHADCILLGCAGMADLAADIAEEIGVPVIDGVSAGVKMVESLIALRITRRRVGG
jgi:allantoin racemase